MKPFENTDKINGYYYLNECTIVNTGYRGLLLSVISMQNKFELIRDENKNNLEL